MWLIIIGSAVVLGGGIWLLRRLTMKAYKAAQPDLYCPLGKGKCPGFLEQLETHPVGSEDFLISHLVHARPGYWKYATAHHSATFASAGVHYARSFANWHVSNNKWGCLGYHIVVERDGLLTTGFVFDQASFGIHVGKHNGHNIGICFAGNLETQHLSAAQYIALRNLRVALIAYIPDVALKTHKDWLSTTCPGARFPYSTWTRWGG